MSPRVVFAGAGSIQFGPTLVADFCRSDRLGPTTLVLHDIDARRLERAANLAQRLVAHARGELRLEVTLDPEAALREADALIISIELDRFETWERDRAIPADLGIDQALGENGGPGGLFHALRIIPGAVELARLAERLAPGALVLNLTNPMSRVCLAISETTAVPLVGLCHEIHGGRAHLAWLLGVPEPELRVQAVGLNHFTWFSRIEDSAGRDLAPRLRQAYTEAGGAKVPADRLLTTELFRVTGRHSVTNDSHAGEYLRFGTQLRCAWAPDRQPLAFYEQYRRHVAAIDARMDRILTGEEPIEALVAEPSGEEVVAIIEAAATGTTWRSDALDLRNSARQIPQLPEWAIVETPGTVDRRGGHPEPVADLPDWLVALCQTQAAIHRLTVRAALEGDRRAALEALLIDPAVPDPSAAQRVFDALLEAHRPYLPRFA